MRNFVIIALALLLVSVALVLSGYLLPETREGTAKRTLDASPAQVRGTILDIDSQPAWRAQVVAVERDGNGRWTENTAGGERIAFRLLSQADTGIVSLEFTSNRGYSGRWDATIQSAPSGGTTLNVREQVTTSSPLGRILSRLFFDPEAFAAQYLDELAIELARRDSETE